MRKIIFYLLMIICIMACQWPISLLGNKIDPFIFGMPYSIGWCVLWIMAGCVVALIAAITNFGYGTKDEEEDK